MNKFRIRRYFSLSRFRSLPLPGKLYHWFSFVALGILTVVLIIMSATGRNIYYVGLETMLLFAAIYFTIVVGVILSISPYKQEYNVFAGIIPALMTLMGLIIATYLWSLHLDPNSNAWQLIIPVLSIFILAASTGLLNRSFSIKAGKLYISSAMQIILAALIVLWFYSGF